MEGTEFLSYQSGIEMRINKHWLKGYSSFYRTKVELKYCYSNLPTKLRYSFYRTKVELKCCNNGMDRGSWSVFIVPKWN